MGRYKSAAKLHRDNCLSEITSVPALKSRALTNLGLGVASEGLDGTFFVGNSSDNTKRVVFALSGATTNKTATLAFPVTNNRTITFPDATDTLVGKATTDELTNKTITDGVIKDGITASGSDPNDFSGSTGTFKTSSGTNTLSGTTSLAANKNLSCASGTTAVDFSGGSGTFKTCSGANTLSGSTTLAANKDFSMASGTGAVDLSAASGTFKTPTGLHTLGGKVAFKVIAGAVAATGAAGGVGGAAALGSATIVRISSDGATKGVKLQTGVAGDIVFVLNTSATAANIFAASGGTINGGSTDVGAAVPASKGVMCFCTAADTWAVFDLPAHAGAAA